MLNITDIDMIFNREFSCLYPQGSPLLVEILISWKDHDGFEKAFKSVVKALHTDGGKLPPPEPKLKPKR